MPVLPRLSCLLLFLFLASKTGAQACTPITTITTSSGWVQTVNASRVLQSPNCAYSFSINSDGGFLQLLTSPENHRLWDSSSTSLIGKNSRSAPYFLELTPSGNLRLVDDSAEIVWETDTTNQEGATRPYTLTITNQGNVILTDAASSVLWQLCMLFSPSPTQRTSSILRRHQRKSFVTFLLPSNGYQGLTTATTNKRDTQYIPNILTSSQPTHKTKQ